MDKKEIKDYLKRVDELGAKLVGEDKETYTWLIYGYNQCAKLLNETEQQCKKQKEVINKANKKLNNFIDCCKAEKLESGSDYIHHQYWDMFERFNKQIKDILKEVSE